MHLISNGHLDKMWFKDLILGPGGHWISKSGADINHRNKFCHGGYFIKGSPNGLTVCSKVFVASLWKVLLKCKERKRKL